MNTIRFSMDGVLINSEYTYFESKTNILNDAGYDVGVSVSYQYQFMGTTYNYMWQTMKDELKLPLEVEDYIKEMNQRRKDIVEKDGVKPIKNIQKLIKRLYKSGFRMAVASSSPKIDIEFAIKSLDLNQYFEFLVSGEEVENSKPEPDIFLYTASLLEVRPNECIVFSKIPKMEARQQKQRICILLDSQIQIILNKTYQLPTRLLQIFQK